jgi:hypothetical protein
MVRLVIAEHSILGVVGGQSNDAGPRHVAAPGAKASQGATILTFKAVMVAAAVRNK